MVKSSEVLRLAAEYALDGVKASVRKALTQYGADLDHAWMTRLLRWLQICIHDYGQEQTNEHTCMALCLAADIAESEGD